MIQARFGVLCEIFSRMTPGQNDTLYGKERPIIWLLLIQGWRAQGHSDLWSIVLHSWSKGRAPEHASLYTRSHDMHNVPQNTELPPTPCFLPQDVFCPGQPPETIVGTKTCPSLCQLPTYGPWLPWLPWFRTKPRGIGDDGWPQGRGQSRRPCHGLRWPEVFLRTESIGWNAFYLLASSAVFCRLKGMSQII